MSGKLRLTGKLNITAKKMLRSVCGILDKNNIPYVLEGGTLLGIVRENRLLPWDNDLDLTIIEQDMDNVLKLKRQLWWAGYKIRPRKSKKKMPHFPIGSVRLLKIKKKNYIFASGVGLMDIFVKKKIVKETRKASIIHGKVLISRNTFIIYLLSTVNDQ